MGCGWGSLVTRASQRGVARSVGLTLSRDQAGYIAGLAPAGTEIRLENWREHHPMKAYDAIVAIGSFEHFAQRGLSAKERVGAYSEFFAKCYEWLPERGRLSLQTIGLDDEAESDGPIAGFYDAEVFPSSTPPRLAEIAWACDPYFSITAAAQRRGRLRQDVAWLVAAAAAGPGRGGADHQRGHLPAVPALPPRVPGHVQAPHLHAVPRHPRSADPAGWPLVAL